MPKKIKLKAISVFLIFLFFIAVLINRAYKAYGGLYDPNKESELLSRLSSLIDLSNNTYQKNVSSAKIYTAYNNITKNMVNSQTDKNPLLAKLVDNLFILKLFPVFDKYLKKDYQRKGWGKPFISYIKFNEAEKKYVITDQSQNPYSFDPLRSSCRVNRVFEIIEGIRHFDQCFETYIYRVSNTKGLMVIRGNYAYVDLNLNGIPDYVYLIYSTQYAKNHRSYFVSIAEKDENIENTTMHSRYTDSLCVVLEYILDNFPVDKSNSTIEYSETAL